MRDLANQTGFSKKCDKSPGYCITIPNYVRMLITEDTYGIGRKKEESKVYNKIMQSKSRRESTKIEVFITDSLKRGTEQGRRLGKSSVRCI